MSQAPSNPADVKMLPGDGPTETPAPVLAPATLPTRQLSELPKDELAHLAEDLGLDSTAYKTVQHIVAAIHSRRQLIASMDRDAMLNVVRWGRRPVAINASKEQIAMEIAKLKSMRFDGLSHAGLLALAQLRSAKVSADDPVPILIRLLKKQEGIFTRLNRKRRSFIGGLVANMLGEEAKSGDYQFLPPAPGSQSTSSPGTQQSPAVAMRSASVKEEIEESGLIGGLSNRIKKTADSYLNQKLDEIEARIDRKLDEIDRRLAEWRDKEVANRIRILKITLWVSVIVGAFSLIYTYVTTYIVPKRPLNATPPALTKP